MDYIQAIESALDTTAEKELLPLQPGDVPDTYADVDDLITSWITSPQCRLRKG